MPKLVAELQVVPAGQAEPAKQSHAPLALHELLGQSVVFETVHCAHAAAVVQIGAVDGQLFPAEA